MCSHLNTDVMQQGEMGLFEVLKQIKSQEFLVFFFSPKNSKLIYSTAFYLYNTKFNNKYLKNK